MSEMKDSGVEWIGKIPRDWTCCKQKYVIQLLNGRAYKDTEFEDEGKYKVLRVGNLFTNPVWYYSNMELEANKYCDKGDLLYSWSMSYAPIIWQGDKVIYHYHIWKAVISDFIDKRFAFYYLLALTDALKAEIHETTMGFITMGIMNASYISYPSLHEQQFIAAYLDSKCAEIDALSADIQSEIDTLEAYKRSVITEAVTKGLDKNVSMKDSGMSWIGNVPEHWRVEKVKYHLQRKEPRNPGNQQILSVYREYGVIPKDSRDDNHNVTSEDTSKYKYVRPGNLVINKMKAWQGSMGVSKYEGVVSPAYFIYHFVDNELIPKYLHYLFRTCYKDEFRRISGGIREGQWDLSPEAFNNTMLLLPSVKEQASIVAYVDGISTDINSLIAKKQEQLAVLADYKKSVIYEYVTGKKITRVPEI